MKKTNENFMYDEAGKKVGVILSSDEFEARVDILENYYFYITVKQRSAKKEKLVTHEEVFRKILKKKS